MGSFSDYLENELMDHIFGCNTTNYVPPADLYLALSTTHPLDTAAGMAEPTIGVGGYARAQCDETDFGASAAGIVASTVDIPFPLATLPWGTITHFAIFDDPAAGNMMMHGSLVVPKAISAGDTPKFAIGDIVISLA